MPSPFGQFKEQQVKPVDILPYTQGIADSLASGIKNLGAGVVEGYVQYKKEQQAKEQITPLLIDEVSKYIRKDDKGKESLDDTAPTYIKDYFKTAEKEGAEDGWHIGATRVSASTAGTAWATHGEWQKQQELNYKLKVQQINSDAIDFQQQAERAEVDRIERAKIVTPVPVVQLYNSKGATSNVSSLDEAMADVGVTDPNKIWTPEQLADFEGKNTVSSVAKLGIHISGDASFSPNTPFEQLSANRDANGNTTAFNLINNVYNELVSNGMPLKTPDGSGADDLFKKSKAKGGTGYNAQVNVDKATYERAIKALNHPQLQEHYTKKGFDLTPITSPVPNDVWIKYPMGEYKDTKNVERALRPLEVVNKQYDAVAERWMKTNPRGYIPSRQLIQKLILGDVMSVSTDPFGNEIVTIGTGANATVMTKEAYRQMMTERGSITTGSGAGISKTEDTIKSRNAYLTNINGKVFGGMRISIPIDPKTKQPAQWAGNWETDYPLLKEATYAVEQINPIADRMIEMTNDSLAKKLIDPNWSKEYENLNLIVQTHRKAFIASGQETDKDNERLRTITGDQGFWLKLNPDTAKKVIEAMRTLINARFKSQIESGGGKVTSGSTQTQAQAQAYLDSIIKERGLKLPQEPKSK